MTKVQRLTGGLRTRGTLNQFAASEPMISVVTIVRNGENELEQTILSVLNQPSQQIEYIIIDGASTDGTLDIIKKYESRIDYWISEPDNGIYNAMNKGIRNSLGEWIGILNSGDIYIGSPFKTIRDTGFDQYDIVYANGCIQRSGREPKCVRADRAISLLSFRKFPFFHPSCFVTKRMYVEHGFFDPTYRIAGDYELLLRLYLKQARFHHIPKCFASMAMDGVSCSDWKRSLKEMRIALQYHSVYHGQTKFLFLLRCLKTIVYYNLHPKRKW